MENEQDRLWNSIQTTQEILCTNCRVVGTVHEIDDYNAAEYFQNKGWRATKHNNVYCPKCAKIKLKARK